MMLRLSSVFAFLALGSTLSPAATITFVTSFAPEALGASGSGNGKFVFDTTAQTLSIDVDWTGLSGTTSVAHIHCCVPSPGIGTVGVAVTPGTLPGFPVGATSGTYSTTLDLTLAGTYTNGFRTTFGGGTEAGSSAALLAGMIDGTAYFNIHTNLFPSGEIRGFLAPVPEPATALLTGVALCGLCALAMRKRDRTASRKP